VTKSIYLDTDVLRQPDAPGTRHRRLPEPDVLGLFDDGRLARDRKPCASRRWRGSGWRSLLPSSCATTSRPGGSSRCCRTGARPRAASRSCSRRLPSCLCGRAPFVDHLASHSAARSRPGTEGSGSRSMGRVSECGRGRRSQAPCHPRGGGLSFAGASGSPQWNSPAITSRSHLCPASC